MFNTSTTRPPPDFEPECEFLKSAISRARVPLVCMLIQDNDYAYSKTIIDTALLPSHPQNTGANLGNTSDPKETRHVNGVPRVLLEARDGEIDRVGAKTKFPIASLAKLLLAITYCIIIENKTFPKLTWDTPIIEWMKEIDGKLTPAMRAARGVFGRDVLIKDVLQHYKALPHMNRFLFLPDGTFQITDDEFLTNLKSVDDRCKKRQQDAEHETYQYSNANYIFMALLLEMQMGKKIDKIVREYLLAKLHMDDTTLNGSEASDNNYAIGQRVSGDLATLTAVPAQRYRDSTAYKITVGTWSCTSDIAKLYKAIFDAESGKEDLISREMAHRFWTPRPFTKNRSSQPGEIALAGRVLDLAAQEDDFESLNRVVRELAGLVEGITQSSDDEPDMYCKSGLSDGNTCVVVAHPRTKTAIVVLANISGPVDVTAPIARHLRRTAMASRSNRDMTAFREQFTVLMNRQLELGTGVWQQVEQEDLTHATWSGDVRPFVGVYQHIDHQLQLEITGEGTAIYSRTRRDGKKEVLTRMEAAASSNRSDRRLQIRPLAGGGIFVDRIINDFRSAERLVLLRDSNRRTCLVTADDVDPNGKVVGTEREIFFKE